MIYWKKVWKVFLRILYPKTCYFCGELSTSELCDKCKGKVIYIKEPRCKKCGKPVRYEEQEYCQDCMKRVFHYQQGRSLWIHKEPVSCSIYQFKYHNRRIYGEFYARELFRVYGDIVRQWEIDVIVPVPLHWKRKRRRGYNQAEIIAKHLGDMLGIPVETNLVRRKYATKPQKELNDKERKKNLKDAFEVGKLKIKNKNILLVDDIYTTGSTINEISNVLWEKGQNKVWFLTISIGQDF